MLLPRFIKKLLAVMRGSVAPPLIFLSVLIGFWFGLKTGSILSIMKQLITSGRKAIKTLISIIRSLIGSLLLIIQNMAKSTPILSKWKDLKLL